MATRSCVCVCMCVIIRGGKDKWLGDGRMRCVSVVVRGCGGANGWGISSWMLCGFHHTFSLHLCMSISSFTYIETHISTNIHTHTHTEHSQAQPDHGVVGRDGQHSEGSLHKANATSERLRLGSC
jgi:hypothetical protein